MKINTSKIKQLRLLLNLNQPTIADMMNMHQTTYSRFENGETKFDLERVLKLAKILKCKPQEIIICDKLAIVSVDEVSESKVGSNLTEKLEGLENKINELHDLLTKLKSTINMYFLSFISDCFYSLAMV